MLLDDDRWYYRRLVTKIFCFAPARRLKALLFPAMSIPAALSSGGVRADWVATSAASQAWTIRRDPGAALERAQESHLLRASTEHKRQAGEVADLTHFDGVRRVAFL